MPIKAPWKEILLGLYLLAIAPAAAERARSLGPSTELILYLLLEALLVGCLLLGAYARSLPLRAFYAAALFPASLLLDAFERVTGQFLSYDSFITMVSSTGETGDALSQYSRAAVFPAIAALLLAGGMILKPRRGLRLPGAALAPVAAVALLSAMLYARGGEGGRGLPPGFTGLAYADLAAFEALRDGRPSRQPVRLAPAAPPRRDIVFVIDESIAANYLDLDAPNGVRSGLVEPRPGIAVHNFGYAASITNCSWGSNTALRYGGTRTDYRRIDSTMPSLFQYAKRAGFRTVYIDAQRADPAARPFVPDELAGVDRVVSLGAVPVVDRDIEAARTVARLLGDSTPDFILVNKVGAHFPVHDKYPDSMMLYRPALPRGSFVDISDTGSRAGFGGSPEEWRQYRNAYRNTLAWNVGAFFDTLLRAADMSKATIVYTSDHGQNLHENGGAGLNTHCSPDPAMEEGLVPLVMIDGGDPRWAAAAASNRNRASAYNIFPTLLELMGYSAPAVSHLYGSALDRPLTDELAFNARFNARLGRKPVWKKIDLSRIAVPPPLEGTRPQLAGGNGGRGKD